MSKHTPGPWRVESADSNGANVVAIAQVAWCGTNGRYGRDGSQTISAEEARANARLIAAAPKLLNALKEMLEYTASLNSNQGFDEYDHPAVKQAYAVIREAKGEA